MTASVEQIYDGVVAGTTSLDDVKAWAEVNAPLYERPPLEEALNDSSSRESAALLDAYCDWEDRARELGGFLRRYAEEAHTLTVQDPERAVRIARANKVLSRLVANPEAGIQGAFDLGYVLWRARRFFDAAEELREALAAWRQAGRDPSLEMEILVHLRRALHGDKQFHEALRVADESLKQARLHGLRGYEASALLERGEVLGDLGRKEAAVESLEQAIEARHKLSDDELREQGVEPPEEFLNSYGQVAHRSGRFQEAVAAFTRLAKLYGDAGRTELQARAVSDIGHTYSQAGEQALAARYLLDAAQLAEQAGSADDASYWRTQADVLSGQTGVDAGREPTTEDCKIESGHAAYRENARAQQLLLAGNYAAASALAAAVVEWARLDKDAHLEVSARNTLGACHSMRGETQEAEREFHRAIQLADGNGEFRASLELRYNLAKVLMKPGAYQRCVNVLLGGIAYCQATLSKVETTEFKQQFIAGSLGLYELFVYLLAKLGGEKSELWIVGMTEQVRARNFYGWLRAGHYVETAPVSAEQTARAVAALKKLRAAEVELEVCSLTRQISETQIAELRGRRARGNAELSSLLREAGAPEVNRDETSIRVVTGAEELIGSVLDADSTIVCLFSTPEGVCSVLLHRPDEEVESSVNFIEWDRDERLKYLAQWTWRPDLGGARGTLGPDRRDAKVVGSHGASGFDRLLSVAREKLFDALVVQLGEARAKKIAVVPHRELALLPYWELVDRCGGAESLTTAPSLSALRLCLERRRHSRGRSVLLDDRTHSLKHAAREIEFIKRVRADGEVACPESVEELRRAASSCSLLHIAAHGLFNQDNPYYSGFPISRQETERGIFARYVSLPSFAVTGEPDPRGIRLMTVAECMTELSLGACRLAVISTCESGLALPHGGGELTGLPNSLLVAGAQTVIASLWPVDDRATAFFMRLFYEEWEGGSGKEASPALALGLARHRLRAAGREEISRYLQIDNLPAGATPFAHPVYSDAFQCYGNW